MKIAKQNCCFGASNYENQKHQEQESKHVVSMLRWPDGVQDEE